MPFVVCALVCLISSYLLIDTPVAASEARQLYQRAASAIAEKDLVLASELLVELVEQHETSPLAEIAAFHLAECYSLQSRHLHALQVLRQWDERIAQSEAAERLEPGIKSQLRLLLPRVLHSFDDQQETLELLAQQLGNAHDTLTPSAVSSLVTYVERAIALELVSRYERRADFSQAQYWLRQVVEASDGPERQIHRAHLYFELPLMWAEHAISHQEPLLAIEVLQLALAQPLSADQELPLRFLFAEALFAAGEPAAATEQFDWLAQQASALPAAPPWLAAVTLRRSELLIRNRQITAARDLLTRAKREQADFSMAYEFDYLLARCAVAQIEFDEATQLLQTVIAAAGKTEAAARAGWLLGEVYFLQRQYKPAIAAYAPVAQLDAFPQWQARAWLQSAKCHELLGDAQAALTAYTRATQLEPPHEIAAEAAERMAVIGTAIQR